MSFLSAKRLGNRLGYTAKETNAKLAEVGYLEGEPGNYTITDKGKEKGKMVYDGNGYGGFCAKSWGYAVWDESVAYDIGDPDAYKKRIEDLRKSVGIYEPFDFD